MIVRGIKAGLPVNDTLKVISQESPDPVGPEFKEIVEGQKLGVPLDQGLERMYERMPLAGSQLPVDRGVHPAAVGR